MRIKRTTTKAKKIRKMFATTLALICTLAGVNIANAADIQIYSWSNMAGSNLSGNSGVLQNDITLASGSTSTILSDASLNMNNFTIFGNNLYDKRFFYIGNHDSYSPSSPTFTITGGGVIRDAVCSLDGAAVFLDHGIIPTLSINFENNKSSNRAGAIANFGSINSITGNFTENKVETTGDTYGGAIYNQSNAGYSIGNISGAFTSNYASTSGDSKTALGGAIANYSGTVRGITGTISSNFTTNYIEATGNNGIAKGGALYNYQTGAINISGATFVGNHADGATAQGGAIFNDYVSGGTMNISGTTFSNNYAKGSTTAQGGAIYNAANSTINFTGTNTFTGNYTKVGDAESVLNDIYNAGIININDGTTTLNGGVTGNGSLTIGGATNGTLTLGESATLIQTDLTVNATGKLVANAANLYITNDITNNGSLDFTNTTFGSLKNAGTLNLNYTKNEEFITSIADNATPTGTTNISVADGKTVTITAGGGNITQDAITASGNGHLTLKGTFKTDLTNNMTGDTIVLDGATIAGEGGSIAGNFTVNTGSHAIVTADSSIAGVITNNGTLDFGSTTDNDQFNIHNGLSGAGATNIGYNGTYTDYNKKVKVVLDSGKTLSQGELNILSNGTLQAAADKIITTGNTITNNGMLMLDGGDNVINNNSITGTGTTKTVGNITSNALISNNIVVYDRTLTTNADYIGGNVTVSIEEGEGTLALTGGKLTKAVTGSGNVNISDATTIGTGGSIASDVVTTIDSALTVDGGTLTLSNTDNLNAQTTLTSGTLNIIEIDEYDPAGITANGGTLNISGDYTILNGHTSIADAVTTNINGMVEIKGATVGLNTGDGWNSDIRMTSGNLTISGRTDTTGSTQTYDQSGGKLTLDGSSLELATTDSAIYDGEIEIKNSSSLVINNKDSNNAAKVTMNDENSSLTVKGEDFLASELSLTGNSNLAKGAVIVGDGTSGNALWLEGNSQIAAAVNLTVNPNTSIYVNDNSSLTLNSGDTFSGELIQGGSSTLNILTDISSDTEVGSIIQLTSGTLNIGDGSANSGSITLNHPMDFIYSNVAVDIKSNGALNNKGAWMGVALDNADTWNGVISLSDSGALTLTGRTDTTDVDKTYNQTGGTLTIDNSSLELATGDSQIYGASAVVSLKNAGKLKFNNSSDNKAQLTTDTTANELTLVSGSGLELTSGSSINAASKVDIGANTRLDIDSGATVALKAGTGEDTWAGTIVNNGTLTLDGFTGDTYKKSGAFVQHAGSTTVTNGFDLNNEDDSITAGTLTVLSGNLNVSKGTITGVAATHSKINVTNNVNVSGGSIGEYADLDIDGNMTISDGTVQYGGTFDSVAGKITQTGGTLTIVENASDKLDVTGGQLNISGTAPTTLTVGKLDSESVVSSIVTGDGKATITINSGKTLNIIKGGSVTLDGGTSLGQVEWNGDVTLNGGSLLLSNIVDKTRVGSGESYNKEGTLTANTGYLTINSGNVLLGDGDTIADAVVLTTYSDITVGSGSELSLTGSEWKAGTITVAGGTLSLTDATTTETATSPEGARALVANTGTLSFAGSNILNNSADTILETVKTSIAKDALLDIQKGSVSLNTTGAASDDAWKGSIKLSGADASLSLNGVGKDTNNYSTYNQTNGTLTIKGMSAINLYAGSKVTGGTINLQGESILGFLNGATDNKAKIVTDTNANVLEISNSSILELDTGSVITKETETSIYDGSTLKLNNGTTTVSLNNNDTWSGKIVLNNAGATLNYDNLTSNGILEASNGKLNIVTTNTTTLTVGAGSSIAEAVDVNLAAGSELHITGTDASNFGTVTLNGTGTYNADTWEGSISLSETGVFTLSGRTDVTTGDKIYNQVAGTLNLVNTDLTLNEYSSIAQYITVPTITFNASKLTINNGETDNSAIITMSDSGSELKITGANTTFTTATGTAISNGKVTVGDETNASTLNFNNGTMTGGTLVVKANSILNSSGSAIQTVVKNDGTYNLSDVIVAANIADAAGNGTNGTLNIQYVSSETKTTVNQGVSVTQKDIKVGSYLENKGNITSTGKFTSTGYGVSGSGDLTVNDAAIGSQFTQNSLTVNGTVDVSYVNMELNKLTNNGTINLKDSAALRVHAQEATLGGTINVSGSLVQMEVIAATSGTNDITSIIDIANGAKLTLNSGDILEAAKITSNAGSILNLYNTPASVVLNGTDSNVDTWNGEVQLNDGTLTVNQISKDAGAKLTANTGNLNIEAGTQGLVLNNASDKIAEAVNVNVKSGATLKLTENADVTLNATGSNTDTWAGTVENIGSTKLVLKNFSGTKAKSGIFQQTDASAKTTVTGGFDMNNSSDYISRGEFTVSSGDLNLSAGEITGIAAYHSDINVTNNVNVSGGSIGEYADLDIDGNMTISDGTVQYGGTFDSVAGKITQTGGTLTIVENASDKLDVTGGNLRLTGGTLAVVDGSSIKTGDNNASILIASGAVMNITGGTVTLDGGADLSRVDWKGSVLLNGGELTLTHIVDQSRAATYNKTGNLIANTGKLTIDTSNVLLGNNDIIKDAVDLQLNASEKTTIADNAQVWISNDSEWKSGNLDLAGGELHLNGVTSTEANNRTLKATEGKLELSGTNALNASDLIKSDVKITINENATLAINNADVTLNNVGMVGTVDVDFWAGNVSVGKTDNGAGILTLDHVMKYTTDNSTYNQDGGTLNMDYSTLSLDTPSSAIIDGTVNLSNGSNIFFCNKGVENNVTLVTKDATENEITVGDVATAILNLSDGSMIVSEAVVTVTPNAILNNSSSSTVYLNGNDTWSGTIKLNNDEALLYYDGLTLNGKLEAKNGELNIGKNSAATLTIAADDFIKGYNSSNTVDDVTLNLAEGSTLAIAGGDVTFNLSLDPLSSEEDDVWNGAITMSEGTLTIAGISSENRREDETSLTKTYKQTGGTLALENTNLTLNSGSYIKGGTVTLDPSTLIFQNAYENNAIFNTADSAIVVGDGTYTTILTVDAGSDIKGTATVDVKANSILNSASDYIKAVVTNNGYYNLTDGVITANIAGDNGTLNIKKGSTGTTTNTATITQKIVNVETDVTFDNDGTVTSALNNSGTITGDGSLVLNADSVNNIGKSITQGSITVNEDVDFYNLDASVSAAIDNYGTIAWNSTGDNSSVLTMTGNSQNHTGANIYQDYVNVNSDVTFTNDGYMGVYNDLVNKGTINTSVASDHFYTPDAVQNSGTFNITGGDVLVYDFVGIDDGTGTMSTTGVVKVNNNTISVKDANYDPINPDHNVNMHIYSTLTDNTLWLTDFSRGLTFADTTTAIANSNLRIGTDYVGVINLQNGVNENLNMQNLTLESSGAYINMDSSLPMETMDALNVTSFTNADNNFITINPNLPSNTLDILTNQHIKLYPVAQEVTDSALRTSLGSALNVVLPDEIVSPIHLYKPTYDSTNGVINVDKIDFNPAVLAGAVAQQGAFLTQINTYDQAFGSMDMMMNLTREERMAYKYANRYASGVNEGPVTFSPNQVPEESAGLWFRPFASFEKVNLAHGPETENNTYGMMFGGDSGLIELSHGWDMTWGAYAGYTGSHQNYVGGSIYQNGGTLGLNAAWYKGNFFTGLTANVGASVAEADTMYGNENMTMLMTGIASKTGYNWEVFNSKLIVQPSLLLSYSFINTFGYENGAGVDMGSSPLNAIQIVPGIKLIGNLPHGWQPYLNVQMVWNIMDQTKFYANDVNLPQMSVDPYIQYGVGLQKRWGDRFTGFGQVMLRNGGRTGVAMTAGFRWAIGKEYSKASKAHSDLPSRETKVTLSSMK